MEIRTVTPPPQPVPNTYDILGLTLEEALFLRDLTGNFCCNPRENPHFHTSLYAKLERVLGHYGDPGGNPKRFEFTTGDELIYRFECKKLP